MHDDEMSPEEFRAAQAAGTPTEIKSGQRPVLVVESSWSGVHVVSGGGGGASYRPVGPTLVPIETAALVG